MESQSALEASWVAAADSRDHPGLEGRQQSISALLSQLTAHLAESWFHACIVTLIQRTYPKQHRCVLDATLQRFVALSPLHCGCILEGFLSLPNSQTLNTPFRRDLTTLFKAPAKLSPACWPQQGAVACSIVSYLATDAAQQLWAVQRQQQQHAAVSSGKSQSPEQHAGIAISWLADCVVQAVPQQQLPLMQLLLAVTVAEFGRLERQEPLSAAEEAEVDTQAPCKRQRLDPDVMQHITQEPQQQLQQRSLSESKASVGSSRGPSLQALQAGINILTAVCCCEHMQHRSMQLVPAAAAAAASAAANTASKETQKQALQCGAWLYQQLAHQLTAPTSKPIGAPAVDHQAAVALPPANALGHILQQLAVADSSHVVGLVRLLLGMAAPTSGTTAAGNKVQQQQQQWLLKAAQQWQAPPAAAAAGLQKGKEGKQAKQQALQVAATGSRSTTVAQLMSSTVIVNATWLCKHLLPILVHTAAEAWQQQQLQDDSRYEQPLPAEAAALVELMADAHVLLPAAGEVIVSARFLAEALEVMEPDLQQSIALAWQQKLLQPLQPAPAAGDGQATYSHSTTSVEWRVLQPMLCLLNHLEVESPFVSVLAAAVQCLVVAGVQNPQRRSGTGPTAGVALHQSSIARDVVRHLLLPVRFALGPAVRLRLLQQLLCLDDQLRQLEEVHEDLQQQAIGTYSAAARLVFDVMQQLLKQESAKLTQGLQLVAAGTQKQKEDQGTTGVSGVAASIGSAVSPEQNQARDLAVVVIKILQQAALAAERARTRGCQQFSDWPARVQQNLADHLKAVDVDCAERSFMDLTYSLR